MTLTDEQVEAARRAFEHDRMVAPDSDIRAGMRSALLAALPHIEAQIRADELEKKLTLAYEALKPFADVAEHDIGDTETDADRFRPMVGGHNRAPLLTVGDLRRAAVAIRESAPSTAGSAE